MKKELCNTKKYVYRATSIMFIFMLFGALGAGLIYFVGDFLNIEILHGASAETFWQLCFWATDFFFVAFTAVLTYLIVGIPGIAPALTLGLFFSHFNAAGAAAPVYSAFFSTPSGSTATSRIGYIGYLVIALMLGYLIKYLFVLWDRVKNSLGPKLDSPLKKLISKLKFLKGVEVKGVTALEAIDLVVLFLIMPVLATIVTYLTVHFAIEKPFCALANYLVPVVEKAFVSSRAAGGLLMGAMVGFDSIGPVSLAAFKAASNLAASGNAVAVTTYGVCFVVPGWVAFTAWILNMVTKKGGVFDTDDSNLAMSGPVNAFFDNMKLTAAFAMPYAWRDPLCVVPCYVLGCAATGLLSAAVGLENSLYLTAEKLAQFASGEIYISFLQPLRSISKTPKGILLAVFACVGSLLGGALLLLLKNIKYKRQLKNGTYVEIHGDIVLEMRRFAKDLNAKKSLWHNSQADVYVGCKAEVEAKANGTQSNAAEQENASANAT